MSIEILMPALSPTMEEGTLTKWFIKEGDTVSSGDLLAEIETDKATMEFEAVDEGVIAKILVPEGSEGIKVKTVIAILLEDGESTDDMNLTDARKTPPAQQESKILLTKESDPKKVVTTDNSVNKSEQRIFASPLARRIAAHKGLDLNTIKGTAPRGRIIKSDVEKAITTINNPPLYDANADAVPETVLPPSKLSDDNVTKIYEKREYEIIKLDGMRKTIAARLTEAKQTVPHFYLRRDVMLDEILDLKGKLNRQLADSGVKISVNDFIIKACALALQQVPDANAVWAGDKILKLKSSDVAVAVAIEGGLFTPVLQDADKKSLSTLSSQMKDLAARARNRKLAPHEYQGGSFAISNLGMFGIDSFDAVINPPHGAILAIGAGTKRPIVRDDGTLGVATVMSVTLSVDHRTIDGTLGSKLLTAIVDNLENPIAMLAW
jgi:pyruvate dehydrogenase E2 component (dihydrolipoamide acetyltransferase)